MAPARTRTTDTLSGAGELVISQLVAPCDSRLSMAPTSSGPGWASTVTSKFAWLTFGGAW